jgi:hypothetical protein
MSTTPVGEGFYSISNIPAEPRQGARFSNEKVYHAKWAGGRAGIAACAEQTHLSFAGVSVFNCDSMQKCVFGGSRGLQTSEWAVLIVWPSGPGILPLRTEDPGLKPIAFASVSGV